MPGEIVGYEAAPELVGVIGRHPTGSTLSAADLEAVVAAVQHPVVVCDHGGGVVSMNPAALALHGFATLDDCRRMLRDAPTLVECRDATGRRLAPDEWPVARATRGEIVQRFELHGQRRDTGRQWVGLYSVSSLTFADASFFLVAIEDVTERRRAEQALRERTTLLRAICDTSADLVFAKDRDGRMLLANPAMLAVLGRGEREVLGKTDRELLRDEAVARDLMEHDRRIMERGIPEVLEEMVPDSSGCPRTWLSTKTPYRDAEGDVIGLLGISRDITDRRRAEEALRESEERYRTLFAHMAEGFALGEAVCDGDGVPRDFRFIEMNEAFEAQTGLRRADVQGRSMSELLPNMERSWVDRYCGVALSGEPLRFESYNRDLDRHWRVFCYSPAKGRFATIFTDISDLKRKEEERTRLLATLRRAAADAERSTAQLEAVIQSMRDGVMVFDTAGKAVLVNDAEAEINGYASGEDIKRDLAHFAETYELAEPDGRPLPFELWPASRVLRGESVADWELRARRRDTGQEWFFSFSGAPVRDERGDQVLAVVITRDVTARMRADEALRRSEEQYRTLAENTPEMIARFDRRLRHTFLNDYGAKVYGIPMGDAIGRTSADLGMPPDKVAFWNAHLEEVLATGRQQTVDLELTSPELGVQQLSSLFVPELDERGEVASILTITRDVTAVRAAEQMLREADRRKDEFLAVLAHELRNPLAPIRNALYIVDRAAPGGEQAGRALAAIDRQVTHLARLVDDLLDVSRITRGKIDLRQAALELRDVARRTVEDYRAVFAEVGVELAVAVPDTSVWVNGDGTRLAQVLGNLLHNAARFTPAGGRVTVAIEAVDDKARLRVRDTGTGIDASVRQRLFQPFAQADRTLARTHGGLGLGLALVKGLVELHGGTVEARDVERGTEFVVELPLLSGVRGAEQPAFARGPSRPVRVLVVEDSEDAAEMLRMLLEMEGHVVEVATDGNDGVAKARSFGPEVVFCDIGLPGKNGYDVARELRADPRLARVVLVAVTGYAGRAEVLRAREAGFDHHVPKPASLEALTAILASAAGAAASD